MCVCVCMCTACLPAAPSPRQYQFPDQAVTVCTSTPSQYELDLDLLEIQLGDLNHTTTQHIHHNKQRNNKLQSKQTEKRNVYSDILMYTPTFHSTISIIIHITTDH